MGWHPFGDRRWGPLPHYPPETARNLLFTLFGLVPACLFPSSWERFLTIIVFFSTAGLVRVYFLELYVRP